MKKRSTGSKKIKLLWITDPWNTLDHSKDTTLRLVEEAALSGVKQAWCDVRSIRLEKQKVCFNSQDIISVASERNSESFKLAPLKITELSDFTQIHYRTDPPVDQAYLNPLQLLAIGNRSQPGCEFVNPLETLLIQNEKFEAAVLGELMPESVVSSQWETFLQFGTSQGRTVLKPLHEAQSHGIELLDWGNKKSIESSRKVLKKVTRNFTVPVILQKYLNGIAEGETRLWYLDGKLLAYIKKHPAIGDFRVNIDRGSLLSQTQLSKRDKQAAKQIGKLLATRKIRLAAVDLIEGFITDFNFTSPGLISQMETLLGVNLAKPIIKKLVMGK
jgi:glutathione synthase